MRPASADAALYAVLGVQEGASWVEIKEAYQRLAQLYHPDKTLGSDVGVRSKAEERMKAINHAYAVLKKKRG